MTTPFHTRGGLKATALPLLVKKREFPDTFILQGSGKTLKKVRVTKSVSRPIRDLRPPSFAAFTFSFEFNYLLSSWAPCKAAPMEGVEAPDAFTFHSHYFSSTGAACEAVPMEGIEYTGPCQPALVQPNENGTARKMAVPKSRHCGVARKTSEQAPASVGNDKEERKLAVPKPRSRATTSADRKPEPVNSDEKQPAGEDDDEEEYDKYYDDSRVTGKPVYVTPYYGPTGVETLHAMGVKGKGVKLGIIDSGISSRATAFKGNLKHNHKFVGTDNNQAEDPANCNNRGTNLAGIAVAKTKYFTGVAPEATLGIYCVFGCTGPTSTSLVLKAITAAIKDQMKIIVLPEIAVVDEKSIELRKTIEDATKDGVIMIVAATIDNFVNQQHFSYRGLPVLSVGGAKQKYRLSHWFEEKTTGRRIEFMSTCSNMKYNFNKEMDIIPRNTVGRFNEYLIGFKRGGIALVWYDRTKILTLLDYAKAIGMTGLIIVNRPKTVHKCGVPLFDISEKDALFIEEGYINQRGYKYIFAEKYGYIKDGNVIVDTAGPQNEPFIPPFYPDILAPSHEIYTTTHSKKMDEPHFSDISAAVAYVAGAIALIAEINDKSLIDVKYAKAVLQNSAVPVKVNNANSYVSPLYQGAGMINLAKPIDTKINIPINISTLSATSLPYKLSHIPAAAVLESSPISNMPLKRSLVATVLFPKFINLQPDQTKEIIVTISTPTNIQKHEIWSYSGYIVIDANPGINGSPSSHAVYVPYYGTVRG
ncbi:peptidase S8/S53 domain-containing protein [Syncephalis fuscata]|nr:peptidase S8/S53 domain-containing protein [Syncephalis fuscata]